MRRRRRPRDSDEFIAHNHTRLAQPDREGDTLHHNTRRLIFEELMPGCGSED